MQGLLAFTFITPPLTSQRKQDNILLCVNTPQCGINTWNGSSRTIGRRLKLLPHPVEMVVTANCRVRDFVAEGIRQTQELERGFVRQAKLRLYTMKDLPIVAHCPVDALRRHLADPVLSPALRFGLEDTPPGGPTEWNQTPFAHQHLLYQKLLSFWTAGHEYRKGDFVEMRAAGWSVARIDDLQYRRASDEALLTPDDEAPGNGPGLRDDLRPRLWLKLCRTTPGRNFHQSARNNLQGLSSLLANHELFVPVGGDMHMWAMAECVEKPVIVINVGPQPVGGTRELKKAWAGKLRAAEAQMREHGASKGVYVCRHSYACHDLTAADDLRHDMYSLAVPSAYVPRILVVRTPRLDDVQDRVLWYSIFVDKYHMHNSQRDGSYNAVYMQVFNYNKTFRNSHVTLIVIAVLPGGADLYTASRGWQQKLRDASKEGFDAWSFVDKRVRKYHVVHALHIADHMQQVETLCHLGNNAKRTGRSSWIMDTQRRDVSKDPRELRVTRRWAQTTVVQEQQRRRADLLGISPKSEADNNLRKPSGIDHRKKSETEGGPQCDPNRACTWDPCHLIEHGYFRFIVRVVLKTLPKKLRILFLGILRDFKWPKGVTRPVLGWTTDVFPKAQLSWDFTKKVVMVCLVRLNGLWPDDVGGGPCKDLYMFLCRFARWAFELMGPVPVDRHEALQAEIDEIIALGQVLIGEDYHDKTSKLGFWDRPNLTGLRELVYIVLPMLGNVTFANACKFEAYHKVIRAASVQSGGHGHIAAMNLCGVRCAAGYACRGGKWGESREFHLGCEFLALRDPRKRKGHLPHPGIVAAAGCWHTGGYVASQPGVKVPTTGSGAFLGQEWEAGGSAVAGSLTDNDWASLQTVYESYCEIKWDDAWRLSPDTKVEFVKRIRAVGHAQELVVCQHDDVQCNYKVDDNDDGEEPAYSSVRQLTIITVGGKTTVWVWPRWYKLSQDDRKETDIEREARLAYTHLGAPIVYLDRHETHDPFPAKDLVSQVVTTHDFQPLFSTHCVTPINFVNTRTFPAHSLVTQFIVFCPSTTGDGGTCLCEAKVLGEWYAKNGKCSSGQMCNAPRVQRTRQCGV